MTSIVSAQADVDREAEGEATLELVAVRYVGKRTLYDVGSHLTPHGWPGMAPLDGGPTPDAKGNWTFAVVPDEALDAIEGRPDLEIVYAVDQQAEFAQILQETGLPDNAVGQGSDRDLQTRLFDALGLVSVVDGGPIGDQLHRIAEGKPAVPDKPATEPVPEPDPEPSDPVSVESELLAYDRNELGDICKELRGDPSEFNLRENAQKTERAAFIAGFDRQEREAAIEAALGGGD